MKKQDYAVEGAVWVEIACKRVWNSEVLKKNLLKKILNQRDLSAILLYQQ